MRHIFVVFLILCFSSCVKEPYGSPSQGGAGRTAIEPEACGELDGSDMGRRVHAFLVASAELDNASFQLESDIHNACRLMAVELRMSPLGDAPTLCAKVSEELEKSFQVSVSQEQQLVTRTKPAVCTTKVEYAAGVAAKCEARAIADINAWCDGQCGGQCGGVCDGTCSTGSVGGNCNGMCNGTCTGRCSGSCQGSARVDASAECRASAEVRADVRTECTQPKVVVESQNVTVIDASRLNRATAAIDAGLPLILSTGARAGLIAKSFSHWVKTAAKLVTSAASFFGELGEQSVCAIGQLGTAFAASTQINARVSVSIQASASISGSARAESY